MSRRTSRARYVLWWVFAAIFAAGLPACYFLFTHGFLSLFNEWIKAQGAVGVFAFATAYVVVSVLLLAPAELMSVAAGVVFGAWGAPLVAISAVIAAIIAFLLSRYLFRAKVKGLRCQSSPAARDRCGHWSAELANCRPAATQPAVGLQFPELLLGRDGHRAYSLRRNYGFRHSSPYDNVRLSWDSRQDDCD
jgi:hypothetical protein